MLSNRFETDFNGLIKSIKAKELEIYSIGLRCGEPEMSRPVLPKHSPTYITR